MNDHAEHHKQPPAAPDPGQALPQVNVVVQKLDGERVYGQLLDVDREAGRLTLRVAATGHAAQLPLAELLAVTFPTPAHPPPPEAVGSGARSFRVVFRDGREFSGTARALLEDEAGLHLWQLNPDGSLRRTLVPRPAFKAVYHALLGKALVEDGATTAGALRAALERQQALHDKPVGEYLRSITVLTPEQLIEALEHQASHPHHKLGELLVKEQLITPRQLAEALALQKQDRSKRLGDLLVQMGATTPDSVHIILARNLGIPFVKLREFVIDPKVYRLVTPEIARKHKLMPLALHGEHLVVAMEDPVDVEVINLLRFTAGREIEVAVAAGEDIAWAIHQHYGSVAASDDLEVLEVEKPGEEADLERLANEAERLGKDKPVVRFVNNVLLDAIGRRASDIHVHPGREEVELLYRVDGTLLPIRRFTKRLLPAVVSRVKIVGRMNIAERRLPQDGGARIVYEGKVVDLRISVIPVVDGESIVIRILNTEMGLKSISDLGFNRQDEAAFTDLLHKSNGMMLVTGPTGCGKSTTLYAALGEVIKQNVNIITVEDPVEYHIEGIEQIQVLPAAGYTFARALRHILRHDPDVIMIGEIRDDETAKIAVQSALTGHLMLSTLHTNDASSTLVRLIDMGVEPYLIGSTLLGVLAQRLVRRNCPLCMAEEDADPAIREILGVGRDEVFYRGRGCDHCNRTGYSGRMAVYELLRITPAIRTLIQPGMTADAVHAQAVKDGMVPLTRTALGAARDRRTSLAEVYRVRLE
jgi:type IV pilus assembly protein PilB